MPSSLRIHVDRCVDALARKGVRPKRSVVAEAVTATFGYDTSNHATVADALGELDPPEAQAHASVDVAGMIFLTDPVAGLPFAVHGSTLAAGRGTRRADHLVSPYGNLVSVAALRAALSGSQGTRAPTWDPADQDVRAGGGLGTSGLEAIVGAAWASACRGVQVDPRGETYDVHHVDARTGARTRVGGGPIGDYEELLAETWKAADFAAEGEDPAPRRVGACQVSCRLGDVLVLTKAFRSVDGWSLTLDVRFDQEREWTLDTIGLPSAVPCRAMLANRSGLIVVAGPKGSGRTTTAKAMSRHLARDGHAVCDLNGHLDAAARRAASADPGVSRDPRSGSDDSGKVSRFLAHMRDNPGSTERAAILSTMGADDGSMRRLQRNLSDMRKGGDVTGRGRLAEGGASMRGEVLSGEARTAGDVRGAIDLAERGALVILRVTSTNAVETYGRLAPDCGQAEVVWTVLRGVVTQRLVAAACRRCRGVGCDACRGSGHAGEVLVACATAFEEPDAVARDMAAAASGRDGPRNAMTAHAAALVDAGRTTPRVVAHAFGTAPAAGRT